MKKHAVKSMTLWINFAILVLSMFDREFFDAMGFSEQLTNIVLAWFVKLAAILNIALRIFFTSSPITFKNDNSSKHELGSD